MYLLILFSYFVVAKLVCDATTILVDGAIVAPLPVLRAIERVELTATGSISCDSLILGTTKTVQLDGRVTSAKPLIFQNVQDLRISCPITAPSMHVLSANTQPTDAAAPTDGSDDLPATTATPIAVPQHSILFDASAVLDVKQLDVLITGDARIRMTSIANLSQLNIAAATIELAKNLKLTGLSNVFLASNGTCQLNVCGTFSAVADASDCKFTVFAKGSMRCDATISKFAAVSIRAEGTHLEVVGKIIAPRTAATPSVQLNSSETLEVSARLSGFCVVELFGRDVAMKGTLLGRKWEKVWAMPAVLTLAHYKASLKQFAKSFYQPYLDLIGEEKPPAPKAPEIPCLHVKGTDSVELNGRIQNFKDVNVNTDSMLNLGLFCKLTNAQQVTLLGRWVKLSGVISCDTLTCLGDAILFTFLTSATSAMNIRAKFCFANMATAMHAWDSVSVTSMLILQLGAVHTAALTFKSAVEIRAGGICAAWNDTSNSLVRIDSPAHLSTFGMPSLQRLLSFESGWAFIKGAVMTLAGPVYRSLFSLVQSVGMIIMNFPRTCKIIKEVYSMVKTACTKGLASVNFLSLLETILEVKDVTVSAMKFLQSTQQKKEMKAIEEKEDETKPDSTPSTENADGTAPKPEDPTSQGSLAASISSNLIAVLGPSASVDSLFAMNGGYNVTANFNQRSVSSTLSGAIVASNVTIDNLQRIDNSGAIYASTVNLSASEIQQKKYISADTLNIDGDKVSLSDTSTTNAKTAAIQATESLSLDGALDVSKSARLACVGDIVSSATSKTKGGAFAIRAGRSVEWHGSRYALIDPIHWLNSFFSFSVLFCFVYLFLFFLFLFLFIILFLTG